MKNLLIGMTMASLTFAPLSLQAACNPSMAEAKPDQVLRNNGNGTVTDKETGLVWMQCSEGQSGDDCSTGGSASQFTWDQALAQVQTANAAVANGYSDWRLPSVAELGSLAESACYNPAVNTSFFPASRASAYWTSSPVFSITQSAWVVNFYEGNDTVSSKDSLHYVRLVRN